MELYSEYLIKLYSVYEMELMEPYSVYEIETVLWEVNGTA